MAKQQKQEQEQELIKLTDNEAITGRGYLTPKLWGENITHKKTKIKQKIIKLKNVNDIDPLSTPTPNAEHLLCSRKVFHAYKSLPLALFLDPINGGYLNNNSGFIWKAKGVVVADDGLKVGCSKLTTIEKLPIPEITRVQRIAFAFLCYKAQAPEYEDTKIIDAWLSGEDRKEKEVCSSGLQKNLFWLIEPGLSYQLCMLTVARITQNINSQKLRINFQEIAEEAIKWQ